MGSEKRCLARQVLHPRRELLVRWMGVDDGGKRRCVPCEPLREEEVLAGIRDTFGTLTLSQLFEKALLELENRLSRRFLRQGENSNLEISLV